MTRPRPVRPSPAGKRSSRRIALVPSYGVIASNPEISVLSSSYAKSESITVRTTKSTLGAVWPTGSRSPLYKGIEDELSRRRVLWYNERRFRRQCGRERDEQGTEVNEG